MPPAVAVVGRDLTKRFRDLEAVRSISFDVPAETCFGFLGPNGAGKTAFQLRDGKICRENGYEIWRRADDDAIVCDDVPAGSHTEVFG